MMGMHWAMWLFWILLIVLVVWGLYRLFTGQRPTSGDATTVQETPLETLQHRYAAGEITTEEYEAHKRTLTE